MSQPTPQDVYDALKVAQGKIDAALEAVEAAAPDIVKPIVGTVQISFDAAFAGVDVPALTSALVEAANVIKSGRGPVAGAPDAFTA